MLCWSRCKNTGLTDLIHTFYSSGRWVQTKQRHMISSLCYSFCHHGDAGVHPTYSVSVCVHRAVPAQLVSAAAAVCHQEEKKDGGNLQAQCRGEKADGIGGTWKTWLASTDAQRRTPHMMHVHKCHSGYSYGLIPPVFWCCLLLSSGMIRVCLLHEKIFRHTKHCLRCTFLFLVKTNMLIRLLILSPVSLHEKRKYVIWIFVVCL